MCCMCVCVVCVLTRVPPAWVRFRSSHVMYSDCCGINPFMPYGKFHTACLLHTGIYIYFFCLSSSLLVLLLFACSDVIRVISPLFSRFTRRYGIELPYKRRGYYNVYNSFSDMCEYLCIHAEWQLHGLLCFSLKFSLPHTHTSCSGCASFICFVSITKWSLLNMEFGVA